MKRTQTKAGGPKPRTIPKRATKPKRPTCMKGHSVTEWGAPCHECDADAAAWAAQLANPPEEMVLRSGDARTTQFFRIPKHLRPRRKARR